MQKNCWGTCAGFSRLVFTGLLSLSLATFGALPRARKAGSAPSPTKATARVSAKRPVVVYVATDTSGFNMAEAFQTALGNLYRSEGSFDVSLSKESLDSYEATRVALFAARHRAEVVSSVFLEKNRISVFLFDIRRPGKMIAAFDVVNADPSTKVDQALLEAKYRSVFQSLMQKYAKADFQPVPVSVQTNQSKAPIPEDSQPSAKQNLLGGLVLMGPSYLFPSIYYQRAFTEQLALQVELGGMVVSTDSIQSLAFDALMTVNYYSDENFKRLWIRLGGGVYRFALTTSTDSETIYSPAVLGTVGWRWRITPEIGAGVSAGAQYLLVKQGNTFTLAMSGFQLAGTFDVAWIF